MNSIQLLANKDIEFFIGIELLKNLDIFTFFMYTFGAYDESTDTILISKLISPFWPNLNQQMNDQGE